jgi:formate C-acetyltransferase
MTSETAKRPSARTLTAGPDDLAPATRALREEVLADADLYHDRPLLVAEAFRATEGEPWMQKRWAAANAKVLGECPIKIRMGERLVGWHPSTRPDEDRQAEIHAAREYLASQGYYVPASEGHMALDYPKILAEGLDGRLERIRTVPDAHPVTSPGRPHAAAFAEACETSLVALQGFIERYADLALREAQQAGDPEWRAELERIAADCEHIAHHPAETFRQALQLMWFTFLAAAMEASETHHCFGPGRIDQYLLPYLEADRVAGVIDEGDVDDLLDQLFVKCNEFHGAEMMSALIIVIGGRTPAGEDATNELSYRMLRCSDRVRMYFPGVDISWHEDMPEDFVHQACQLLRNGKGPPSFFNDAAIIRGLERHGVPYEHAVDHLPSTCTETSIAGRCNPWVAWPYMNLPMAFLDALAATPDDASWDDLLSATDEHIRRAGEEAIAMGIEHQAVAAMHRPFPLLSCFIDGCIESGTDISHGGATHNFLQPEGVGVVTVVDSLAAIKSLAFDGDHRLADLKAALASDWKGFEDLHRELRLRAPRYGNDDGWINGLFARVAGTWCEAIEGSLNYYGGPVLPGFLGWVVWIGYGEQTPATPDGRKSGEPLSSSMAPRPGAKLKGIPSMILSAGEFDNSRGLGGTTYNVRFSGDDLAAEGGPDRLKAIVETALGQVGLYMLQIDVTSSETLREAQRAPADYTDLFVRIGGYLVSFTHLPAHAQEEVIERTELGL